MLSLHVLSKAVRPRSSMAASVPAQFSTFVFPGTPPPPEYKIPMPPNYFYKSRQERRAAMPPKPPVVAPTEAVKKEPTPQSKRCGVLAFKAGMTGFWNAWGARIPLTVLQIDYCQVIQIKTQEHDGYDAMQLGVGFRKLKNITQPVQGHLQKYGVGPKRKIEEFHCTPDAFLPYGFELRASHFVVGQYVDVSGTSKGKGTQGVMKRWNFSGQPASHGASLVHRMPGSTGNRQDPGRVFKGRKMAGRLGNETITVQNLLVYKIDHKRNLVYVKGAVPGCTGSLVRIKDAVKQWKQLVEMKLPFPTYLPSEGEVLPDEVVLGIREGEKDPLEVDIIEKRSKNAEDDEAMEVTHETW